MAAPVQDIITEPAEQLVFKAPFTKDESAMLKLTNAEEKTIAFKVKCTNNAKFKIRPPMGVIKANESADVKISLLDVPNDEPTKAQKERIVVFTILNEGDASAGDAWQQASIGDQKSKVLAVVFQAADETEPPAPAATPEAALPPAA